jgi:hypothetical protein
MTPTLGYPERTADLRCTCSEGSSTHPHHERCPIRRCPNECMCSSCTAENICLNHNHYPLDLTT